MIIYKVFQNFVDFVIYIFSALPDVPDMPQEVLTITSSFIETITGVKGFFTMIYGDVLFYLIVAVVFGIYSFSLVYHTVMWIVRKIPMLSIR
jgi:hypothetical protein